MDLGLFTYELTKTDHCPIFYDVIKWKHFPSDWPVVRGIHWSLSRSFDVFFGQRLNNGWVNNGEAGDSRRHCTQYDVIVMSRLNADALAPKGPKKPSVIPVSLSMILP